MTRKTGLFAAALFAGAMACMGCGDNNKTDGSVNGTETAERKFLIIQLMIMLN